MLPPRELIDALNVARRPVLSLAQKLGGGGHSYSAGVRVRGPMAVVVEQVLAETQRFLVNIAG